MIRPSKLPILAVSPLFESKGSADADAGVKAHELFKAMLEGKHWDEDEYDPSDIDGVEWAVEDVRCHASSEYPLQLEQKGSFALSDFSMVEGTPDAVAGPIIFDLKSRQRDYAAQMAAYALMNPFIEQGVECHLLFRVTKQAQVLHFTEESARAYVEDIIAKARAATTCKASEYCSWCARSVDCPVLVKMAAAVASGREDWELGNYHSSQITEGTEMAKALTLARRLATWCKSVEHSAKEFVTRGQTLPGFELKTGYGKQYVADVVGAFPLAGVPQDVFLKCCYLRMNTSKTYPDKVGIIDAFAIQNQIKRAPAKRELMRKLEPVISRTKPSSRLVAVGEDDSEEQDA